MTEKGFNTLTTIFIVLWLISAKRLMMHFDTVKMYCYIAFHEYKPITKICPPKLSSRRSASDIAAVGKTAYS